MDENSLAYEKACADEKSKNISDFLRECENISDWMSRAQEVLDEREAGRDSRSEDLER